MPEDIDSQIASDEANTNFGLRCQISINGLRKLADDCPRGPRPSDLMRSANGSDF